VQLKEAAELMGRVLTGDEEWSISSSEMAVVNDIRSSSEICKELLSYTSSADPVYYMLVLLSYTTRHRGRGKKKNLKKVTYDIICGRSPMLLYF